jgi:PAS domain S-box-containing protein
MPNNPGKATAPAITPVDQMRRLMEATFEGAFLHEGGVVLDANRAAAALFGRAVGELNRCCISELIAEESCKALMRQIHSRSSIPCPITARRKDGTDVPLEIVVKATLTCNGRRLEVLVVSQNVTSVPACRVSRVRRVTPRTDPTKN